MVCENDARTRRAGRGDARLPRSARGTRRSHRGDACDGAAVNVCAASLLARLRRDVSPIGVMSPIRSR